MRYLIILISFIFTTGTLQAQNVISINASAEVLIPADKISFHINLNAESETPQKVYNLHKEREEVLVKLLEEYEIKEENINFEPISINKGYNNQHPRDQREVIQSRQKVVLTLDNFDIYEQIQIALISNGFDEFSGNFMSSKSEKGKDKALTKALSVAQEKAKLIAKKSGLTITGIKDINYSYNRRPPRPMMEMSATKSSDSLMEFDQTVAVSANISVVYNFEE